MLWKVIAALMTVLWIAGGIIHGYAVKDMADYETRQKAQGERMEAIKYEAGLLQLTVENVDKQQSKMDKTLTEVRDAVIRIEAKIE